MANLIIQQLEPDIIEAPSFAEALAAMPNVGTDADFERIQSDCSVMMEYKQQRDNASMVLLDELTAEAQVLDMGY